MVSWCYIGFGATMAASGGSFPTFARPGPPLFERMKNEFAFVGLLQYVFICLRL
jgi:hypothetical protein